MLSSCPVRIQWWRVDDFRPPAARHRPRRRARRGRVARHRQPLRQRRAATSRHRLARRSRRRSPKVGYVPNTRGAQPRHAAHPGGRLHRPRAALAVRRRPQHRRASCSARTPPSRMPTIRWPCLIVDSERDTDRVARYLSGGSVDGAIIVSARAYDPDGARRCERLGLPAAFVGHPPGVDVAAFVGDRQPRRRRGRSPSGSSRRAASGSA